MKVSIVIACKKINPYLEECLQHCLSLDYPDYEIFVLPDDEFDYPDSRVKIISTGPVTPPVKRNRILGIASGKLIAFIDDDAYPRPDWLKVAIEEFKNPEVAGIGGPAITPPEDGLKQLASGLVYESFLVSDGFTYRYRPGKRREVDDYPSCNFIIRKDVFESLGGFRTNFWPGEDTFLCLEIVEKLKKKIFYIPELVVYHHRRPLFIPHLKQVANYALHRGYFAKRYSATSLKVSYFIPSLFVLVLIFSGFMAYFFMFFRAFFLFLVSVYLISVFLATISSLFRSKCNLLERIILVFLVFPGMILTHFTYGIYFLKGLSVTRLKEEI